MTSQQWPSLGDQEELVPKREVVYRQILPKGEWFYNGKPTLKIFDRSSDDNGELSVCRGVVLTAYGAYVQRICEAKKPSVGSLEIPVESVENFGSRVVDNYSCGNAGYPLGHAYIDYRAASTRPERRLLSQNLLDNSKIAFLYNAD